MARPALRIEVSAKDQKELRKLVSGGVQQVRVVLRALALLQLAKGVAAPRIAGMIPLTAQAIRNVGRRYQQGGLDRALYEKQRPGAAEVLDESQKQRLIAMVCSSPEGREPKAGRHFTFGTVLKKKRCLFCVKTCFASREALDTRAVAW